MHKTEIPMFNFSEQKKPLQEPYCWNVDYTLGHGQQPARMLHILKRKPLTVFLGVELLTTITQSHTNLQGCLKLELKTLFLMLWGKSTIFVLGTSVFK